jgi:hypothetical protein
MLEAIAPPMKASDSTVTSTVNDWLIFVSMLVWHPEKLARENWLAELARRGRLAPALPSTLPVLIGPRRSGPEPMPRDALQPLLRLVRHPGRFSLRF